MDCERFRYLLDAYIDGVLTDDEMRQFTDHADACEECREELRAAEMLRDMMKDMDADAAVPLQAQAAWRSAVRAEAKKLRMRKAMRFAYAAAAALVLVIGSSFAIDGLNAGNLPAEDVQPMMIRAAAPETEELIASDGADAEFAAADVSMEYTAMKKFETEKCEEACRTVELLCEEYTGIFTSEVSAAEGKREITCRIELPYEYMSDFLNAASRIGTEFFSEIDDAARETAVILIQICEK